MALQKVRQLENSSDWTLERWEECLKWETDVFVRWLSIYQYVGSIFPVINYSVADLFT